MKPLRIYVLALSLALSGSVARADLILRKDGSVVEAKVISRDSKALTVQIDAQKATQITADTVARVIVIDDQGAFLQEGTGTATPAKHLDPKFDLPPEPAGPTYASAAKGSTYYVIPLHGVVGQTVLADALEKSLADAARRIPTVVVLDIDSPGGLVTEAESMMKILHRYNKQLRIVALAGQNLSAAAITSMSVKEIYMKSNGTVGAATAYDPVNLNLPPDIKEKMQSAWRAVARNSAEEGGHEPLMAEAMIDSSKELYLEAVDGKKIVHEGTAPNGAEILCKKGRILTLTSHEAVKVGLAVDIADDFAELGDVLKLKGWTECPGLGTVLAEYLPKRWAAYEKQMKDLDAAIKQNLEQARSTMPSEDVISQRLITSPVMPGGFGPYNPGLGGAGGRGGRGMGGGVYQPMGVQPTGIIMSSGVSPEMRAKWKDRSLATVVALQKVEQNARDEMTLSRTFGQTSAADSIEKALPEIAAARAEIYSNRNKYAGDSLAATRPAPTLKNAPLPVSLSNAVKDVLARKTTKNSPVYGGVPGGEDFQDVSPDGILIGLRCGMAKSPTNLDCVASVQPVFLTPKGPVFGKVHGNPSASPIIDVIAKDGYAVAGAKIQAANYMTTIILNFSRITATGLDPKDSYDSETVGRPPLTTSLPPPPVPAGIPIGILGKTDNFQALSLGLFIAPPGSAGNAAAGGNAALTPLTPALAATIKKAVDAKTYVPSPIVGGSQAKDGFNDLAAEGVLIGLRCGVSRLGATTTVSSVQPVYLTPRGVVKGDTHGMANNPNIIELIGRDGYVVGAARISGTTAIDGLKLTFVRLADGKLNTKDAYDSELIGNIDKSTNLTSLTPVIGITGKGNLSSTPGLGLLNLRVP